ncbi:DUF732 domain-containing protein, partial [Mycobacterium tuberculosis]|nr:DUF732 domain-containing protein [Mycobacterium tuberculosis]
MEAALAIATLVLVLVLCLAGVTAVSMQVRCIDAAHKVCRKLDGGMPVNDIVDGLRNDAYNIDP